MKIGIVTIARGANYGNRLQNYATQEVFRSLGCNVETVAYDEEYESIGRRLFIHRIKSILFKRKNYSLQKKYKFYLFNKHNIKFSKVRYFNKAQFDIKQYDMLVVGSDQVWNLYFDDIIDYKDLMFLTFVPREKKIAYSASIGTDSVPFEFCDFFAEAVKDFSEISMRETQGSNIVKDFCGIDITTTIDPTLMLSKERWLCFSKKPRKMPIKEYVVVYFVSPISDEIKTYIELIANFYNIEIVPLKSGFYPWVEFSDLSYFCADPQEFVYYIANAKLVITDSFHASVFSTIFKRPFRVFGRKDWNMSSRIQELIDKINLGKWCIGNIDEPAESILFSDYAGVDQAIEQERKKALIYLKKALNI